MRINKNRKNPFIILALIAFCLSVFSVGTSVHAADRCEEINICSAPAPTFKLMTSFMKEMITAIKTIGTRDPYLGKYVSPSRFEGSEFKPPAKEGLVSKFMRSIRQTLQTVAAVTAIFTDLKNFGGVKDFLGGILIIFKNKVFFRDYKTLMELDSFISDKKYELGLGGGWTDELNEANQKMFQKILDKYGPEGDGLFSKASISTSATYKQITMLITRINSSLKTFIASPGLMVSQFSSDGAFGQFTKEKLYSDSPDISLGFNPLMISGMKTDYQCAQGLTKCDDSITKFVSNIAKIAKSFGSGSVDAWKTIASATKRLGVALTNGKFSSQEDKDAMLKRQRELLQSQLGIKMPAASSGGFLGFKSFRTMIQNAAKKIKSFKDEIVKDLVTDNQRSAMFSGVGVGLQERKAKAKKFKEQRAQLKQTYIGKKFTNEEQVLDSLNAACVDSIPNLNTSFYNNLDASMNAVYAQASADKKSMFLANNVDVTFQFFEVLSLMKKTIDDVIGSRNKDKTLIKTLGEACKAQCANAGGKCFY